MSVLSLVIKREFIAKVRNKSFLVMTFLSPLLFVGIAALVGFLSTMKSDLRTVAVHDASGKFFKEFKSTDEYHFEDFSQMPIQSLKDSVGGNLFDGLLFIPKIASNDSLQKKIEYYSDEDPNPMFIEGLEDQIASQLTQENYLANQLDAEKIEKASAKVNIYLKKASGEASLKGMNWIKAAVGGFFGYLIMMFIIIYGNMVMRSVIEEKTNRIIEIIISSVKPFQLMMGKIIGTSLAGVLQFSIWAILGLLVMTIGSMFFGVEPPGANAEVVAQAAQEPEGMALLIKEIQTLPIFTLIISFIVYFTGGYFLYSSFYAAIGAAVDNETDSQQFLMPIIMPLMLGVYIGFFTVINDPHGAVATIFSIFPLTSPIVMLMRIPFGVPIWQLILSIVVLFGTFTAVVWLAARIYRIGILMYGKKPTWKEMIKWLRY